MENIYCPYCGCATPQEFRQYVPTYEEARQREAELYQRMESGQYGLGDMLVAKVMRAPLVRQQREKIDGFFRDWGLDPGQDIEGKAMYCCTACDRINFV
ncbi:MAG: hypothetical protein R3E13_11710 [Alphaproteobacteria bacterium]